MITQEVRMELIALAWQGYNFSQIDASMGLDRRTVKKPLQGRQPPVYRRPPRSSTLDGFGPLYAFHMVLDDSRDASVEYTDRQDLGTFWACDQHAFTCFGGVPDELLHDRTTTVVKHSGGLRRERHLEAIAFAGQYGLTIHRCLPRHPANHGQGREAGGHQPRVVLPGPRVDRPGRPQ